MKALKYLPLLLLTLPSAQAAYYNLAGRMLGPKLVFAPNPSVSAFNGQAFTVQPKVAVVKPNGSVITNGAAAVANITLSVYSDNRCTTPASYSLSGTLNQTAVSGVATFSGVAYAGTGTNTIYLKAKAPGIAATCSAAVLVSTDPGLPAWTSPPFRLAFNGPASIPTNTCTAYEVALLDQYGGSVAATSALTVNLSGVGSGSFYSDSGCSSNIANLGFAAGANKATLYYKVPNTELNILEATDPTGLIGSASLAVNLAATKITLSGPQVIQQGLCHTYTLNHLNSNDTPAGAIDVYIDGYQAGAGIDATRLYTTSGCSTGEFNNTNPINVNGSTAFYVRAPNVSATLKITASAATAASATLTVGTSTGSSPTKLVISGSLSPVKDRCTEYTVSTQDGSSLIQPTSTDRIVNLSKTGSAQLYLDRQCKLTTTQLTISAGTSQAKFYMKDATAESLTLTATSSGLSNGTLNPSVVASGITPKMALGSNHSCILMTDKTIKCWGDNSFGQLGNGTNLSSAVPVSVLGLSNVIDIAAGSSHTCAIVQGSPNKVKCWGFNGSGQLGNGGTDNSALPITSGDATDNPDGATAIAAGTSHTCVVLPSSPWAKCWGANGFGQIGNGNTTTAYYPQPVSGFTASPTVTAISAGGNNSCVLLSNQSIKCWGTNTYGQLGAASNPSTTPQTISGVSGVLKLAIGNAHICALLSGSPTTVKCWGYNSMGQLGNGSTTNSSTPVTATNVQGATEISTGNNHSCALIPESPNRMKCWGENTKGQIGDGSQISQSQSVYVSSISGMISIGLGQDHSCAVFSDGSVKCWGLNSMSQLGNGIFNNYATSITNAISLTDIKQISLGSYHACARLENGKVFCWGSNSNSQYGNGTSTVGGPFPVETSGISDAITIATGSSHNCAIISGPPVSIKCWGINTNGVLGNGTTDPTTTPVTVSGDMSNSTSLSLGYAHSCALLSNGNISCWGMNNYGQIGTASNPSTTPAAVSGISNATAIAAGSYHTCALLADQTVRCWGRNNYGQIGNSGSDSATPVDVGLSGVIAISAGQEHTCALLNNQRIKCWGRNISGQLGNIENYKTNNKTVPVEVLGINNAIAISTKGSHTCAILSDKSVKCWGYNNFGELGNGSTVSTYIPSKVTGLLNSITIATSTNFSCSVLSEKTARCWGSNNTFQLGINPSLPNFVLNLPE